MCARADLRCMSRNSLYHRCGKTGLWGLCIVNLPFPVHVQVTYFEVVDTYA